jgi:hypothetical protein
VADKLITELYSHRSYLENLGESKKTKKSLLKVSESYQGIDKEKE